MSLKIYNAYKLKNEYNLFELNQKFDTLRAEINAICIKDILSRVIRETLYFYHFKQIHDDKVIANVSKKCSGKDMLYMKRIWNAALDNDWFCVYVETYMHLIDEISKSAKSPFMDNYDYRCILQIIPLDTKTLVMYFGNQTCLTHIEAMSDFLQDYHYQNQTDRPNNISKEAWSLREKDWDKAIGPDYIPCQHGFSVSLFNTDNIMPIFDLAQVKDINMPTVEEQLQDTRESLTSISSVIGYPSEFKPSEWLEFIKSDPYKEWVKESNKAIQQQCDIITDFNEFCNLLKIEKEHNVKDCGINKTGDFFI